MCVETDGIEGNENGMENSRQNRIKDVGDEHDSFGQKEKHREHDDDDIVVGNTATKTYQSCAGR